MSATTFIYALCHPVTMEVRYIGKSDKPSKRLTSHIACLKKDRTYKANWLRGLRRQGLRARLQIVDEVPVEHWQALEAAYIQFYLDCGMRLTNATQGGEGVGSGPNHPNFGKPMPAWQKALLLATRLGHKKSPETLARMREVMSGPNNPFFGKHRPSETREKIRNSRLGVRASVEARNKMSLAHKAHPHTPESRAKLSRSHLGKTHSLETRLKMSVSQRYGRRRNDERQLTWAL